MKLNLLALLIPAVFFGCGTSAPPAPPAPAPVATPSAPPAIPTPPPKTSTFDEAKHAELVATAKAEKARFEAEKTSQQDAESALGKLNRELLTLKQKLAQSSKLQATAAQHRRLMTSKFESMTKVEQSQMLSYSAGYLSGKPLGQAARDFLEENDIRAFTETWKDFAPENNALPDRFSSLDEFFIASGFSKAEGSLKEEVAVDMRSIAEMETSIGLKMADLSRHKEESRLAELEVVKADAILKAYEDSNPK